MNGQRISNTNCVRHLDETSVAKFSSNKGLCNPTSSVCSGAINLGRILTGESSTTVCTPSTVSVNNNFTASKTSITVRPSDDEASGRVEDDLGLRVHELVWHNLINDLSLEVLFDILVANGLVVLGRDKDSMDSLRNHFSLLALNILNDDLSLSIRTHPLEDALLSHIGKALSKLGCKHVCKRHESLFVLISSVTEHMSLVSSSNFIIILVNVNTLGNIR
mmetsp:Transcript_19153/g.26954  ORF Transcript_19153/g.26954 Transcript_19153/m.26954 type:complete len:220 (+) Transcript_19153:509-1168(+)